MYEVEIWTLWIIGFPLHVLNQLNENKSSLITKIDRNALIEIQLFIFDKCIEEIFCF